MNDILFLIITSSLSGSCCFLLIFLIKKMGKERISSILYDQLLKLNIFSYGFPLFLQMGNVREDIIYPKEFGANSDTSLYIAIEEIEPYGNQIRWILLFSLCVSIGIMVCYWFRQQQYKKILYQTAYPLEEWEEKIFQQVMETYGITRSISCYKTAVEGTPLLIGLRTPVIYLPKDSMSAGQLVYVLQHEITHDKRKDLLYQWILLFFHSLFWFNPISNWYIKEARQAVEMAVDCQVLQGKSKREKRNYFELMMLLGRTQSRQETEKWTTLSFASEEKFYQRRMESVYCFKRQKRSRIFFISLFIISFSFLLSSQIGRITIYGKEKLVAQVKAQNQYEEPPVNFKEKDGIDPRSNLLDYAITEKVSQIETVQRIQKGNKNRIETGKTCVLETISCEKDDQIFWIYVKNYPEVTYSIGLVDENGNAKFYKTMEDFHSFRVVIPKKGTYHVVIKNENNGYLKLG